MSTVIVTPPTIEPVSLAEMRQDLKFEATDASEDALISACITAARESVEAVTGLKLISQTWKAVYDAFPDGNTLKLPFAPLVSVTSVITTDKAAAASTLSAASYIVDAYSVPGRIVLKDTANWPAPAAGLQEANAIAVTFVCGYGATTASVPGPLKQAVMRLAAHLYVNREPVMMDSMEEIPYGIKNLIAPYRTWQRGL
jgi:uncharacterized phiE125 gp8 family phage protein